MNDVEYFGALAYHKTHLNDAIKNAVTDSYQSIPVGIIPGFEDLRQASLNLSTFVNRSYPTFLAGARWDLKENMALKYEFRYMKDYFNIRTSLEPTSLIVNRLALDMVF